MSDKITDLALVGSMALFWLWSWSHMRILLRHERHIKSLKNRLDRAIYPEENRCSQCAEQNTCPAKDTGVIYPCAYYKEEQHEKE